MLKVVLKKSEFYDDGTETFINFDEIEIELEHSLISLSKWESKYQKPFLSNVEKSPEEILEYIYLMILTKNIDKDIIMRLTQNDLDLINKYIESKESATTFGEMPSTKARGEIITSELIYYWMVAFTIPFECQYWHLNRLFSLIRICNIKNSKPTKMSPHEIATRNRELNARRRAELGTTG